MDDREIVAAIAAGDLAGLAGAYDEHAGPLYGYCHWMLGDPDDASDAVQDTFVVAASRISSLGDPRRLRPWLYAVARNECQLRLDGAEPGLDEAGDLDDPHSGHGEHADQRELRESVRDALGDLNPAEREVVELELQHDLHGADLAAVLGVPRNQAHALAIRARDQLDKELGALLVARTGRRACPDLDLLLDDWDGELTGSARKQVGQHIDQCDVCAGRLDGMLRPALLRGLPPLFGPPLELRDEVLQLCTSPSPQALAYRGDVTGRAGPFRPNGFPEAVSPPRRRMIALSGVAAAVGILIAITATGIVAVLALSGAHPPRPAAGAAQSGQSSRSPGTTAGGALPAGSGPAGGATSGVSPTASASPTTSTAPQAPAPSSTPARAKPSPSHSATSAAPTPTRPKFTFSPTSTPTPTTPSPSASSSAAPAG